MNVNVALLGYRFLTFCDNLCILSLPRVDVRLVDPEKEEPVGGGGGGPPWKVWGGAPKESLSRGVLLKSSLTDKILSFHFHDPNQERMISFSLAQIHFILPT